MDAVYIIFLSLNTAFAAWYFYAERWNKATAHTLMCCMCAFMIVAVIK